MPIRKLYQFLSVLFLSIILNTSAKAISTSDLISSDNCYYVPQGSAYDAGSSAPVEEAQCSCFAGGYIVTLQSRGGTGSWFSDWFPRTYEVYWGRNMWGDTPFLRGPQYTYASGTDQNANLALCEAAQKKRIYSSVTKDCYETVQTCKEANRQSCTESEGGYLFLYWVNDSNPSSFEKRSYNSTQESNMRESFKDCVVSGNTNEACLNQTFGGSLTSRKYDQNNIYRCQCEESWACGVIPGAGCERICKLVQTGFSRLAFQQKVETSNPLLLLKVVVDTIFYLAVFIFIVNMMSAGFDYLRSGGDADKLKGAQTRLTNTIFGFVFVLLIAALINYIVSLFETQIITSTTKIHEVKEDNKA